jgi:hypothetical protein
MSDPANHSSTNQSSLIKINSASQEDLQSIQGIGPLLSARIMEYRSNVGTISHKDQLHAIKGLRAHQIEKMANLVDWSENDNAVKDRLPSASPAIILSASILVLGLYLIYPMATLFLEEFTHWENNLLHWYTNSVNLLAMLFTITVLLLTLAWLLSLFYEQSPGLTKGTRIARLGAASCFVLLLMLSAIGYFLFNTQLDVTAYMENLLVVVAGVLILVYLQYLPQLIYLGKRIHSPNYDKYYDYSLMPLSFGILISSLMQEFDLLSMDVFLLWIAILLLISSVSMLQRRSYFADLLQELSGWPNIMQNRASAALQLGNVIREINERRSTSFQIFYLGGITLIFSLAAALYNLYKVGIRFIY